MKHRLLASALIAGSAIAFFAALTFAAPTTTIVQDLRITGVTSTILSTDASGFVVPTTTSYVATNTGNWAGTWQGANSSTFYLASNPDAFISTSTNNFGGLTNASITATLPITWSGSSVIACPTCIATNTGNWAGTWHLYNPSDFLSSSTSHLASYNVYSTNPFISVSTTTASAALTFSSSSLASTALTWTGAQTFDSTTTFNSSTITNGISNTGNVTTTNLSVSGDATANSFASNYYYDSGANVDIYMSDPYITLVPGTATGTAITNPSNGDLANFDTSNLSALNTYYAFPATGGTFALGTGTSALALWNASGTLEAYGGNSTCTGGEAVVYIAPDGHTTCSAPFLTSYNVIAGTGISVSTTTNSATITNTGVTSFNGATGTVTGISTINSASGDSSGNYFIKAGTNITITTTTTSTVINSTASGGGAATSSVPFTIEYPNANENDVIWIAPAAATIKNCYAVNSATGDTVTFNLGYSTSRATATSSLTHVFSSNQTVTSITTPTSLTVSNGSLAAGDPLIFFTTAASSTQFNVTCDVTM